MAIDFPNSPSVNDKFTVGTKTWMWDGTTWIIYSAGTVNAHAGTHAFGSSDPILITANQISDFNASAVTANSSHINATTSVHGISNTANLVYTSDSRLTNSRTPNTHASSHSSGGSDAITIAESQVTNLVTDLGLKAALDSPTFTGTPSAPTAAVDTSTTQIATTAYVNNQGYLKSSTAASTYLTTSSAVSTYATLVSPYFSGTPSAPTASSGTNNTQLATTAFVATALLQKSGSVAISATAPATPSIGDVWVDTSATVSTSDPSTYATKSDLSQIEILALLGL
jgi:hypothetical protein